ncbi:MAG: hypothetical protein IPF92_23300 [Myxococcales bacterium]|nr:hypothetical protein [Myxococcales bacterium]
MSNGGRDPLSPSGARPPPDAADDDRDAILSRRARFVAATLAGLAGSAVALACSTESPPSPDTAPQPCLSPQFDSGTPPVDARDATTPDASDSRSDADANDAAPLPCLKVAPDASDAAPLPCLAPPLDSGR